MIDKEKGFVTYDDVRMKLHNSFILHKGKIVVALADVQQRPGGNNHMINVYPPKQRSRFYNGVQTPTTVDYRSDDVDISSIPLGYINTADTAILLERHPFRKNNQAVTVNCVYAFPRDRAGDVMYTENIQSLITGEYPSFEDALAKILDGDANSVAISRLFALSVSDDIIVLRMRKRDIGYIASGRLVLYELPDRSFIIKQLLRLGVTV